MADSQIHVALAGNPNCGKTTLFNLITGANGYVGNWPGVTVEKKEAKLLSDKNVTITDLPGIYSLSPYSPEEQCSRDYLMSGEPDVVVQVVDATNLERNLYLALQVIETGLPVVVALNMADLVEKNGDKIDTDKLSKKLGCPVMMISALKNKGIKELFEQVKKSAASKGQVPEHKFDSSIEDVLDHIENNLPASVPANKRRYYAVKLFERDADACKLINLTKEKAARVGELVAQCEQDCDDDAESIITGERYGVIAHIIDECLTKAPAKMSTSEKIDRVVTNRILGLPIFVVIMFCVYYIAVSTLGGTVTDFTNDQLFGTDGWYVLGQGRDAYDAAVEAAGDNADSVDPAQYGPYVPGITTVVHDALVAGGTEDGGLVDSLVCDGIVGGLGAIFGFVPQMFLLFVMLSFLEDCGYMARVAFIMDRIFRRFGLSGKSFIPILVGTGCGVPGVMASRTIENERDRRMTIMTTCFIPCGAKMPIIGLIAGALFGGNSWVATSAYFIGFAAIIISGVILKKTKLFAGDPAPFVMELPAYHVPAWGNVLRATWERGWSFIKRAGTVILAATIILWFLQGFGFENGAFTMVEDQDNSILAIVASAISWIFIPQGFGNWRATVASISGLIAKENVVGTFGVLYHYADELSDNGDEIWPEVAASFTAISAYSFMIFNLLCAPCFAAMGAIKREMNNGKWTAIAIGYMCLFAYCASLVVYQIGGLITGEVGFNFFTIVAVAIIAFTIYLLFRPNKYEGVNEVSFDSKKAVASK